MIKALLDDELDPATAAFFDRLPGELTGVDPHFDAIGHRSKGATIWIALDKADQENGCLYYVKGTHEQELENKIGLDFTPETPGAIPVIVNPGDAAIHSTPCVCTGHLPIIPAVHAEQFLIFTGQRHRSQGSRNPGQCCSRFLSGCRNVDLYRHILLTNLLKSADSRCYTSHELIRGDQ